MGNKKIPGVVAARLSIYYRSLSESRKSGIISSEELSNLTGFTAAQIRRDLAYFGQFGIPGRGYYLEELKKKILQILGIDREWKVALIGVGNIGSALLAYRGFRERGFEVVAAFDKDLRKIGKVWKGVKIYDIRDLPAIVSQEKIKMAIITVPAEAAQQVIQEVVAAGIRSILNFAPVRVRVPPGVKLLNIDMTIELERLSYLTTQNRS